MKKSLTINAVMSGLKTILQILFPLITFPYISNVLQVENLGKVNFANSVCGYFLLFAGLGISSYAVREGSKYVNDREKLSAFHRRCSPSIWCLRAFPIWRWLWRSSARQSCGDTRNCFSL